VYSDYEGNVYYRHRDAAGWSEIVVDPMLGYTAPGAQVAITLDDNGSPLIAYLDPTNKDLRYATLDATRTKFTVSLVTNSGDVGFAPSITLDPATKRPVIGYLDLTRLAYRVATLGSTGTWTFADAITGTISQIGGNYPRSSIAFDAAGDLHMVAGEGVSQATDTGYYDQPPAFYARRHAGVWTQSQFSADGLVPERALAIFPDGAHVMYGVVTMVGQDDGLRQAVYGASAAAPVSDELVGYDSNFLYYPPVGIYGPALQPHAVYESFPSLEQRIDDGYWQPVTLPSNYMYSYVDDVVDGAQPRFLQTDLSVITAPVCVPQCDGKSCGLDTCGGTCGTCSTGTCEPDGTCGAWKIETVNPTGYLPGSSLAFAVAPDGALGVADWSSTGTITTSRTRAARGPPRPPARRT
jgi:hypothetical protein